LSFRNRQIRPSATSTGPGSVPGLMGQLYLTRRLPGGGVTQGNPPRPLSPSARNIARRGYYHSSRRPSSTPRRRSTPAQAFRLAEFAGKDVHYATDPLGVGRNGKRMVAGAAMSVTALDALPF
jgi:hypothetical protein